MNRITRFSSAAFGMLMIAGLAYYQGHEDPTVGEQDVLIGTAVSETKEKPDPDLPDTQAAVCEKRPGQKESGQDPCVKKDG